MPPEVQSHIFEPFYTTKPKDKGTGLGLSTVYGIVKQNNGHISVFSRKGEGTVFKIYLPAVERMAESAGETETVKRAVTDLQGSESVLVVEDEETVREMALRTLKRYGYTVYSASTGANALKLCKKMDEPVDLLLTDIVMPRMSGRELAKKVTGMWPGVKLLYMSGYTQHTIDDEGILDPEVNFLPKPFRPVVLVEKVREVLDRP